ncbi:hypothetical protein MRX96_058958 [Rhipicephalus microplus]
MRCWLKPGVAVDVTREIPPTGKGGRDKLTSSESFGERGTALLCAYTEVPDTSKAGPGVAGHGATSHVRHARRQGSAASAVTNAAVPTMEISSRGSEACRRDKPTRKRKDELWRVARWANVGKRKLKWCRRCKESCGVLRWEASDIVVLFLCTGRS